ncbi:MAG TPA: serine protease [Pyrinomonadaceae bacterium]|nr:serine protease [Pyrinomonadaceae bacterium]
MRIPDEYLQCVCFLCVKVPGPSEHETDEFIGTGFIVSVATRFPAMRIFCLVTAKHIIKAATDAGHVDLYVRMNTDDGSSITWALPDDWYYSENPAADVAVMFIPIIPGLTTHSVAIEDFATDEVIQKESIGIGDDVFAIGLFTRKSGEQRNTPIMRSGIIASMPEEPFEVEEGQHDAYLVELRSIGGISGSPVFVNLPFWRLGPEMFEARVSLGEMTLRWKMHLLGVIRSHWNLEREDIAEGNVAATMENKEIEKLNTGIAVVTPIKDVLSIINGEAMMEIRKKAEVEFSKRYQPTMDPIIPPTPKKRPA